MLTLPEHRPEIIDFLSTRRSNLAKFMQAPGPTDEEIDTILTIGARVPDHRKLAPWRFIVIAGDARENAGAELAKIFKAANPNLPHDRIEFERNRFLRTPLVVGVVSSPVEDVRGTPQWEQELSSAIVCYNLCLAAQAHGYGAQWLTEWYAYDKKFGDFLGLDKHERISGFIYIGTVTEPPTERPRPDLNTRIDRLS